MSILYTSLLLDFALSATLYGAQSMATKKNHSSKHIY